MIYIYIHNYTAYTVHVTANWWKGFCSSSEHDRARTGPTLLDPLEQAGFCFASVGDGFVATKIEAFRWKKKKTTRFPRAKWHHVQRRNVGCVEHRRLVPAIFLEGIGWVWKEKHHENLRFQRLVRLMIYLWYLTFVYLWVMRTLDVWWQQWRWSMFDGWLKLSLAVGESPGKYHS